MSHRTDGYSEKVAGEVARRADGEGKIRGGENNARTNKLAFKNECYGMDR